MTETNKKEFHPAYMCAILPTNIVILAIIAISIGAGTPGYYVMIMITAFYIIACIPLSIITFVKIGKHAKANRMAARQSATNAALRPPSMQQQPMQNQQPTQYRQSPQPRPSTDMDPIYAKGLQSVADEIVQQLVPKPVAAPTPATAPASAVSQPVTTIAASRSMVMKPVAKTAEVITSAEAVAAKRAMLERVLAPQTKDAQALASEVMGSIASTKAVKGLKKGAAGAAGDVGPATSELDTTEKEVGVEEAKTMCIVHKGPISGAIYLCPKCKVFYCFKCAEALKKNGEKCWSCKAEIEVPLADA